MTKSWTALGVPERIVAGLLKRGIAEPFPVQAATIPESLMGLDICGKAPTGSGKTLAFGIALAVKVVKSKPGRPHGLVLVPTRELAAQVAKKWRCCAQVVASLLLLFTAVLVMDHK